MLADSLLQPDTTMQHPPPLVYLRHGQNSGEPYLSIADLWLQKYCLGLIMPASNCLCSPSLQAIFDAFCSIPQTLLTGWRVCQQPLLCPGLRPPSHTSGLCDTTLVPWTLSVVCSARHHAAAIFLPSKCPNARFRSHEPLSCSRGTSLCAD